jgi:glycosyltransferase involved in cell wall biosynthesis
MSSPISMNEYEMLHILKDKKIARVATVPYSIATQIGDQVAYLRDIGMQVVIISGDGPELARFPFSESLRHECIEIYRSINLWKDIIAVIKLFFAFRKHQFMIVHSITPKAGLLTAVAGFFARVPIRIHTFTGQPWVNKKGMIRLITRFCDRLIGILNTKCYADSRSQMDFLIEEGIISQDKISVIGAGSLAGVDLKRFDSSRWSHDEKMRLRSDLRISHDSKVITFVGRIAKEKGIIELIQAFLSLLHNHYNIDLLLIGPMDQDRGGQDVVSLDNISKSSRIHFIGYTDIPERYLLISDIFCLPSYREGFGTVVIEAAAMGVPCVGSRIYGLTDAVQDGQTGILVTPQDSEVLKNGLKHLLDNPKLSKQMGKAARERVEKEYDARIINEKTAMEYSNLIG